MLETFFLIIGLVMTGVMMRRSDLFPASTADVLNAFILNISLPAIIIISIPQLKIAPDLIYPVLIHWVLYFIHLVIILRISKALNFSKSITGCLAIVTCLGNTAFLGIPVVSGFYGEGAVAYAVLYDQLGSGIGFLFAMAVLIPKFIEGQQNNIRQILSTLLKFPPFLALIFSFILIKFPLFGPIENFFNSLSKTLIPCAMVAVGYQMNFRMTSTDLKPIVIGLFLKLIFIPCLAIAIFRLLDRDLLSLKVSVLQAGMPPMVTAGALAMSFDLEKEISAALVGYGLLLSFLTLPFFHSLLLL